MVCRLVLCQAWDTKVLVVNFYTDPYVFKVVFVRRSHRDEMECGWKDVFQSAFHVCQHRQLSEGACDADGTFRRVTRKPSEGDVCYSVSLVLLCTVRSSDRPV